MIDARTMSKNPALKATRAMISSGALPNVALSRPPMASPVRVAICSVESTMSRAIGRMERAAEKNRTGGATCAYSSATEMGMKARSQLRDGFMMCGRSGARRRQRRIQAVHEGEEESRRPATHQDAGERLDAAVEPPLRRQDQVAVSGRRVGDGAEVRRRLQVGHSAVPDIGQSPHRDFD